MPVRTDYVLRAVEQLAQALARVLGLRRAGRIEAAIEEVDGALASIAGVHPGLLAAVDARAIAAQLREPARMRLAARLAAERASLLAERGDAAGAERWRRKAAELEEEARRAGGAPDGGGSSG